MFKKILFATTLSPSSDAAARVAFDMAGRYDAELWALHIVGVPTRAFSQLITDSKTGEEVALDDNYISCAKDEMKEYYAAQIKGCPNCVIEASTGVAYREILRKAREENVDLIVLGGSVTEEDKGAYRQKLHAGSTLHSVAKKAQCPVLVVGRPAGSFWGGFSNIVFATDFTKHSANAFKFALKAAKAYKAELNIFSVLDVSGVAGQALSQDTVEDELMEMRRKMRRDYSAQLKDVSHEYDVWEGIPYVEIVKFAREKGADLIVMALQSTGKGDDGVLDSTMEQVVMRANCPVICVNRAEKA